MNKDMTQKRINNDAKGQVSDILEPPVLCT
jgi:hypothetical protein